MLTQTKGEKKWLSRLLFILLCTTKLRKQPNIKLTVGVHISVNVMLLR